MAYALRPAPAEPSIFEDDDLDGPEPVDPDPDALIVEDNFDPGDTSIVSLGFSAQGRGQGVETALRIPDFVIDRARGNARRLVVLIEVKAKTRLNTEDFQRFARYYFRLGDIDQAGGAVQGAQLMLIAGGRAYVWDYGNWPARTLRTSDLAQMTPIAVDTREFLGKLREIRDSPQLQIV
ncbi:hypothetical protein FRC10_008030 [Ceratobasidium sp. 414]|nr:hypothetical protein FRC10_008030 [Ceratobasidium sp. 414]